MKGWSNSEVPAFVTQVPEKRLLAAVLQRAITDFLGCEGDLKESAEAWLYHDEPEDAPLTFRFICEALDLDMGNLRNALFQQSQMGEDKAGLREMAM